MTAAPVVLGCATRRTWDGGRRQRSISRWAAFGGSERERKRPVHFANLVAREIGVRAVLAVDGLLSGHGCGLADRLERAVPQHDPVARDVDQYVKSANDGSSLMAVGMKSRHG